MFYVGGFDVAEGLITGDYSAGIILDEKRDLCAAWHGHIDPDLYGYEIVKLAQYYNGAYVGIESNNHGLTTIRCVQRQEYWNIYFQKMYDKVTDTITQKVGWNTNRRTKPLMIDTLTEYIREHHIDMPWELLVDECLTYVKDDDGKTNAQAGANDDTVIAMAIAIQMLMEGRGNHYDVEVPNENNRNIGRYLNIDGDEGEREEIAVDKSENEEYAI